MCGRGKAAAVEVTGPHLSCRGSDSAELIVAMTSDGAALDGAAHSLSALDGGAALEVLLYV